MVTILKMCVKIRKVLLLLFRNCLLTSMKCLLPMKPNSSTLMWITLDFAESCYAP